MSQIGTPLLVAPRAAIEPRLEELPVENLRGEQFLPEPVGGVLGERGM
jgi:hypothetical protein